MKVILLIILSIFLVLKANGDQRNEAIKDEIEAVASESRSLANELAEMLSVLEVKDLRNEAVEYAVIGDDENVQKVLKAMVDRINKLENNSEDVSDVNESTHEEEERQNTIGTFSNKEQRLTNSLDNLEVIANEIKTLALSAKSQDEIKSVNQMAKILEAMTAKLSLDEVKISVDLVLGREDKINIVENDIEGMIDSLVQVVGTLTDNTNSRSEEHEFKRGSKQLEEDINEDVEILQINLENELIDDETKVNIPPVTRKPIIIRRKLEQQLDDGLLGDEVEVSGENQETGEEPEGETCRTTTVTSSVNICVPDFETHDKPGKIFGQQPQELRHCYEVTKTVCEDVTNIVSREVCVYPHVQKAAMAIAHVTEIGFETRLKGMEVSRCHTYIENGIDEQKEVEKCKNDFVEKEYWIPTVYEGFEDFIELDIPDPQKHCQTFRFDVPDTICRDITTTECSDVSFLEDTTIPTEIQIAVPAIKPQCELRVLSQHRQVCTVNNGTAATSQKLRKNLNPTFLHNFFDNNDQVSDDYPIIFTDRLELEDLFSDVVA